MCTSFQCVDTAIEDCVEYKFNGDCIKCVGGKFSNSAGDMCFGK